MTDGEAQLRQVWAGATFPSGEVRSLVCVGGRVQDVVGAASPGGVTSVGEGAAPAAWDVTGWTMLPRFADAHVHLDKTLWGSGWRPHQPSTDVLRQVDMELGILKLAEPTATRAARLLRQLVRNGVTATRSHVDVSADLGLRRLEPLLALREAARQVIDIQLVAFPQSGLLRVPGTFSMLRDAVQAGCEVVGGLDPHVVDGDREGHLKLVVGLAAELDVRVDLHLHERGGDGATTLLCLADVVTETGLQGRVAVSHAFALADLWTHDRTLFERVTAAMAALQIAVVTSLPGEGLCPPLSALQQRNVPVVVASDNIRDSWTPFGRGDPLERAHMAAYMSGWRTDRQLGQALALVTAAPSTLLGLESATLEVGDLADFTLVKAASAAQAVVDQPAERVVVRRGQVVAGRHLLSPAPSSFPPELVFATSLIQEEQ